MIEHLSNCHGEWNAFLALIGSVPFIGVWLRVRLQNTREKDLEEASESNSN